MPEPGKPKRLRGLRIEEVSLVDAGANQHAAVRIFKRHDDDPEQAIAEARQCAASIAREVISKAAPTFDDMMAVQDLPDIMFEVHKLIETLADTVRGILFDPEPGGERKDLIASALASFSKTIDERLPQWFEKAATKEEHTVELSELLKRLGIDEKLEDAQKALAPYFEKIKALLTKQDERVAELEQHVQKLEDEKPKDPNADLPEPVRKRIEDAEAKVREAEERVAKIEEQRERKLHIAKAAALKNAPIDTDKLGEALFLIHRGDAKAAEALYEVLTAYDTRVGEGELFRARGYDGESLLTSGTAVQKMDALAKELVKESGGELSYAQAHREVQRRNPGIYDEYITEQRRRQ